MEYQIFLLLKDDSSVFNKAADEIIKIRPTNIKFINNAKNRETI